MPETENRPETIWIIGASEGIGAALAREWARRGARLVLSARSADKLTALAESLGPDHRALPLDIAGRDSIKAAAEKIASVGPLDRIVHLAALYDPGSIADADPDRAAKIVTVNLTGSFHIAQIAPPLLRAGGQLALCGSVAGYIGLPQGQIYSATKAGVINLAETLRTELAGRIDVRLICPGFVDTRMTRTNTFNMPAMVTPETAACAIIHGLNTRRFEVHFPRRFTYGLKLLSALPYWAALPLIRRFVR
ncbi:short-chain dehydrogenase [Iodidimonas muriae]|uniref:Short-chain dehydrogenase n=1 Tax=Iodidimonas muriae TaxID=261467 RepID=A0ABQ2LBL6_9PROT|nr:SDR family NAD(P)-dependent oxidoreductase [Iodidimonas muriae]GER06944.1 short-chain dehydrogenase [Kordiimonadales bacterium JCM 17843]GGO09356.1 short-chain dehydrogenase [Iodidimonas muriae]